MEIMKFWRGLHLAQMLLLYHAFRENEDFHFVRLKPKMKKKKNLYIIFNF